MISFVVYGRAETQGSKVPRRRGDRVWLTEGSGEKTARHASWREAVARRAREWREEHGDQALIDGPVVVSLRFYLPKPASAPKRRITWPKSGDIDKLARACLDSLTHTIITNDNLVVAAPLTKEYGDPPRVEIDVEQVPEDVVAVRLVHTFVRDDCECDRGWVAGDGGLIPCAKCRPAQYAAWLSRRYESVKVSEP